MNDTGVLSVKITGDETGLKAALERGIQDLNKFSSQADGVLQKIQKNTGSWLLIAQQTTIILHGVVRVFKLAGSAFSSYIQQSQAIDQMSKRLGIARDELQMLKYAAEQSGLSIESVSDAMKNFSNTLGAANLGDEAAKEKLLSVGIDAKIFDGKDMSEQFDMLANHIASIEDPTERARIALELFGESGFQLLPMLEKGGQGIDKLKKQALESGAVIDNMTQDNAIALGKAIDNLKTVASNFKNIILGEFTSTISSFLNICSTVLSWFVKFNNAHPVVLRIITTLITHIGLLTVAVKVFNAAVNANPLMLAISATAGVVAVISAVIGSYNIATREVNKNTESINKNAEAAKKAAEAARKAAEEEKKAAEAAKKAKEGITASENSLADSGKSSAQKEVEKIDEEIKTFQTNWHARKNWLRQQNKKGKLTEEERKELKSMNPERYYDYINAQKQRQNEIRSGLSHHDYQPENLESEELRVAKDNLATLRARGASAPEVAQAEKAVKEAEMRFTQVALQSSGQEKEQARREYLAAKEAYENSGDKNEFEQEALYKAMVEAQKKSQEADANFTRLAEQNYKMHEVKMPEYEYKSAGGTFNAFAVAALGADIPKQQLEVLQQVAGKMDDIINNQQEAGVFA